MPTPGETSPTPALGESAQPATATSSVDEVRPTPTSGNPTATSTPSGSPQAPAPTQPTIFIGTDHRGFAQKTRIAQQLNQLLSAAYQIQDLTPTTSPDDDFNDSAIAVARAVQAAAAPRPAASPTASPATPHQPSAPTSAPPHQPSTPVYPSSVTPSATPTYGILICGSAHGIAIQANRFHGIRAICAYTPELAAIGRQHNDANILCLSADFMDDHTIDKTIKSFFNTKFLATERYIRRIQRLDQEENYD